jgi:hypothetical protein
VARRLVTDGKTEIIRDNTASAVTDPNSHRQWSRFPVDYERVDEKLVDYVKALQKQSDSDHSRNRARERIYEGIELLNNRAAIVSLDAAGIGIAKLNATKSIIDTFVSRLSKDRPMPNFDTTDGDWQLKRKAKKYRQFIVGEMLKTEFDDLSRETLVDGAVLGNGYTRIDSDDDVFAESMPVNEVLYDKRECRYGKPQQAFKVTRVARDYLAELYPKFKDEIRRAPASARRPDDDTTMISDLDDYVDTYEGWQLPATKESHDGRHTLCIEDATLLFEEWFEPRFPWAHLRLFKPRPGRGLMGFGFVDQLASLQHRVNCIVRDLQLNIAATGRGFFAVNEANDIPVELLTGWQPFKLKFKGSQPPTWQAPTSFNPAQLDALRFFIQQMYDLSGVSQANATSKSALGAGASGVALDTQYDIDSDRFRMPQANYARYRLDAAQRYIDAAARVARRRANEKGTKRSYVQVSWKERDAIERLEYNKVELKEGQYCLKIEAVNFLPDTRAGKLAVVEQLAKAGVIEQWLVPTLFDEPDLVQANGILLAAFKNAMRKMDELADPDLEMPIPEHMNDLQLELKLVTAYYNRVQEEKAPPEVQDRYYQYEALVKELIKRKNATSPMPDGSVAPEGPMMPEVPPQAPAEGPLPGGVPMMPPGPVPAPAMIGAPAAPM